MQVAQKKTVTYRYLMDLATETAPEDHGFHDHGMNLAEAVDFLAVDIHREHTLPASHGINPYDWMDGLHCGTNVGWSSARSFKALSHGTSLFVHWLCLGIHSRETL